MPCLSLALNEALKFSCAADAELCNRMQQLDKSITHRDNYDVSGKIGSAHRQMRCRGFPTEPLFRSQKSIWGTGCCSRPPIQLVYRTVLMRRASTHADEE